MKMEKIKPIPQKIVQAIKRWDLRSYPKQDQHLRFYAYMATNDKELVKITVAVKNYRKKWYCKVSNRSYWSIAEYLYSGKCSTI